MRSVTTKFFIALALASPLAAQTDLEKRRDPELWLLRKVIKQAVAKVRPSVNQCDSRCF